MATQTGKRRTLNSDLVMSPKQVAEKLGVSPDAVYSAIQKGDLPSVKLAGRHLISVKRFNEWLDGKIYQNNGEV